MASSECRSVVVLALNANGLIAVTGGVVRRVEAVIRTIVPAETRIVVGVGAQV